jgi:hypothetical protein
MALPSRLHANAKPVGSLLHDPCEHVSELPGLGVPEIAGSEVLDGGVTSFAEIWAN